MKTHNKIRRRTTVKIYHI